jgi:hypothetical protein
MFGRLPCAGEANVLGAPSIWCGQDGDARQRTAAGACYLVEMVAKKRPKHSRLHYSEEWSALRRAPFDLGTPGADPREKRPTDFSYMASPPGSPEIVYLWRRFVSARDAISYFRLDDPGLPRSVPDPKAELQELRRIHRDLVDRHNAILRKALAVNGPDAGKTPNDPPASGRALIAVRDEINPLSDEIMGVLQRIWPIRQHLTRRVRKEVGDEILKALGNYPFDYSAARLVLSTWCGEPSKPTGPSSSSRDSVDPRELVRHQLSEVIDPLLVAYEDPRRFFVEVLPEIELWRFTEGNFRGVWHLGTWKDGRPVWPFTDLADLLHRWGYGVLLNPDVRAIFEKAALEPTFSLVLAQAEGKRAFLDVGPRPKVDYEALRREYAAIPRGKGERAKWKLAKAKELAVKPHSLDRYLRPSFRKKP